MTLREALAFFCEPRDRPRDERRIEMASKIAQFPFVRELAGFEFDAQPSLDPGQIRELATCRWIAQRRHDLLLLGPPGVGKTHLAVGLGREAIRQTTPCCSSPPPRSSPRWPRPMPTGRLEERLDLARPSRSS